MSLPVRTRPAALCAAVSAALILGMTGTAIAYGDPGDPGRSAPVAALSSTSVTTSAPSPEPTPAVPSAHPCDPCSTPHTRTALDTPALGTGSGPTP